MATLPCLIVGGIKFHFPQNSSAHFILLWPLSVKKILPGYCPPPRPPSSLRSPSIDPVLEQKEKK